MNIIYSWSTYKLVYKALLYWWHICIVVVKLNDGNRENHKSGIRSRSTFQQRHFFAIKYISFQIDWKVALKAIRVYEKLHWITNMVFFHWLLQPMIDFCYEQKCETNYCNVTFHNELVSNLKAVFIGKQLIFRLSVMSTC